MSFQFHWPTFSPSFYSQAKDLLCNALNKGDKPAIIADRIEVKELDMGTIPPELEILEIGDMGMDRFRGIFRLTYNGDAYISLQTKVQANPLRQKQSALDLLSGPSILFAASPLIVPMNLRLSDLRLRAIVVLVISRRDGITLVFKNDPLESVTVSSTFDSVAAIQAFVQKEIESQLRELFRTDLPGIVHRLSQTFVKGELKQVAAESGPAYQPGAAGGFAPGATISTKSTFGRSGTHPSVSLSDTITLPSEARDRPSSSAPPSPPRTPTLDNGYAASVPESVASYDPTYGLRSEFPPLAGRLDGYRRLVKYAGLGIGAALTDVQEETPLFGVGSASSTDSLLGHSSWEASGRANGLDPGNVHSSQLLSDEGGSVSYAPTASSPSAADAEVETFRAVGGGTITRPRVLHNHSSAQVTSTSAVSISGRASQPSTIKALTSSTSLRQDFLRPYQAASAGGSGASLAGLGATDEAGGGEGTLRRRRLERFAPSASDSAYQRSTWAGSAVNGTASTTQQVSSGTSRRSSLLPSSTMSSTTSFQPSSLGLVSETGKVSGPFDSVTVGFSPLSGIDSSDGDHPAAALLDPDQLLRSDAMKTDTVNLLATLAASNHTLSPFGRALKHVASRSTPVPTQKSKMPLGGGGGGTGIEDRGAATRRWLAEGGPAMVKPRRKRVFKIGAAVATPGAREGGGRAPSPSPSDSGSDYSSYFPRRGNGGYEG